MPVLHLASLAAVATTAAGAVLVELDMLIDAIRCGGGCW